MTCGVGLGSQRLHHPHQAEQGLVGIGGVTEGREHRVRQAGGLVLATKRGERPVVEQSGGSRHVGEADPGEGRFDGGGSRRHARQ